MPLLDGRQAVSVYDPESLYSPQAQGLVGERTQLLRSKHEEVNPLAGAAQAVTATIAQTVDTFGTSLGILDDGSVEEWLGKNDVGSLQFLQGHRQGVTLASDIAGMFLPAGIAVKAVRSGSWLNKLVNKTTGKKLDDFFSTGKSNRVLFQEEIEKAGLIVKTGTTTVAKDPAFLKLRKSAIAKSVKDVLKESVAADAAIFASMNSSELINPADYGVVDHLAFYGVPTAIVGGGAWVAARISWGRMVGRLGPAAAAAQNPAGLPLAGATDAVDSRGPKLFTWGTHLDDVKSRRTEAALEGVEEQKIVEVLAQRQTAIETQMSGVINNLAQDSVVPGATRQTVLSSEEKTTLLNTNDASAFFGTRSFDNYKNKTSMDELQSGLRMQIEKDKIAFAEKGDKFLKLQDRIKEGAVLTAKEQKMYDKLGGELTALRANMLDNERSVHIVHEIDGTITGATGRQEMFQDGERKITRTTERESVTDVDGYRIIVGNDGTARINAEVAGDALNDAAQVALVGVDKRALLRASGFNSQKDAIIAMDEVSVGVREVPVTEELAAFRQTLGDAPFTVYKSADNPHTFSTVKTKTYQTPHTMTSAEVYGVTGQGKLIGVELAHAPVTSKMFASLPFRVQTALYDTMQHALEHIDVGKLAPEMLHGSTYGKAEYLAKAFRDNKELGERILGDRAEFELDTLLNKLDLHTVDGKFKVYQHMRNAEAVKMAEGSTDSLIDLNTMQRAINTPTDLPSMLELFEGAVQTGKVHDITTIADDINKFRVAVSTNAGVDPRVFELDYASDLAGSMLRMPRDRKPVAALVRNMDETPGAIGKDQVAEQMLANKMRAFESLKNSNTIIVRAAVESLKGSEPQMKLIKERIYEVIDGAKAEGWIGQTLATQELRIRETIVGKAIDMITADMRKATDKMMDTIFAPHRQTINRLLHKSNSGDMTLFFAVRNSLAQGWDALPQAVMGERGVQIPLDPKSARNQKMWRELFGEAMPDGATLPQVGKAGQAPAALTVTQEAADAILAMNRISQQMLKEYNALRVSRGLPPIAAKSLHLPPKDLAGKEVVYLMDYTGKIRAAKSAATKQEAKRLAQQEIEASGGKLVEIDSTHVQRYYEARSRAWFELDDYSQPGGVGAAKGTTAGVVIETGPEAYKQLIQQLERGFADVARETRTTLFESEIQFLKFQHQAAGYKDREHSMYNLLINRFLGTQLDAQMIPAIPRNAQQALETTYDYLMKALHDAKLRGTAKVPLIGAEAQSMREYKQLTDKLGGEFNPFNSFNDYLERTAKIDLPPTLRQHSAVLNEVTSAFTIRILDAGMFAINMLSLATTLPAVTAALKRAPEQTREEWLRESGIFATHYKGDLAELSVTKSVLSGLHFYFSKEGREFARKAAAAGYFDQFAAEEVRLYGSTGENFVTGLLRKAADITSVATDWSERQARAIAFMSFANMGKKLLKLDSDEAVMSFAHGQANNVIGDFRPDNRPAVFQGAAGMPFALFTTFLWNFLQRQYSMVANKQISALVNQVGLQTMLFGAESYPGVQPFINTFTDNYDGSENIVDRMNRRYGFEETEIFLNGTLSSMTGISFSPRAAIGLPGERGIGEQSAPGVMFAKRVSQTVNNVVQSYIDSGEFNADEMRSIIARANLNKFTSNAIELYQGYAEDARGSLIEKDTRTAIGIGARVLGFKPFISDELKQENRRNRITDKVRGELKERLGHELKTKIRSGTMTADDFDSALARYVRAGGNPESFQRYFVSQIVRGTTNKVDEEIAKAVKNNNDTNRTARLLFLTQ